MSFHHQVLAGNHFYTVADDVTMRYEALAFGRVVDEVTQEPLAAGFRVAVDRADVQIKTMADGWFVISGAAERIFPNPNIVSFPIGITCSANGFIDRSFTMVIPSSVPVTVELRPNPIRVQGRVMGTVLGAPIPGARVVLVDDPNLMVPPTEHLLALRSPVQFSHEAGVTVRASTMPPVAPARILVAPAVAGTPVITIESRNGIAVGDVLAFGADRSEYSVVAAVAMFPANLSLPGDVTLRGALQKSYPIGTAVQKTNPTPGLLTAHLAHPAARGDGLLILDGVVNVPAVQIADTVPANVEYQNVGALTDADGYYRLDGIGRVRELFLQAESGGQTFIRPWTIRFGQPVNSVDFRLNV